MIDRSNMPQIRSSALPHFMDWARGEGFGVSHRSISADKLSFRQAVDADHAAAMGEDALAKTVVVASDLTVLDGNHRAACLAALGRHADTMVIHLPFDDAIALMWAYPGVMNLDESVEARGR